MPDPAAPSLSSCVLCGRDVDDGVAADLGGLEIEVHDACAEAGLEGMDLASPHGEPDADDGGEEPDAGACDEGADAPEDEAAEQDEPAGDEPAERGAASEEESAAEAGGSEAEDPAGDEPGPDTSGDEDGTVGEGAGRDRGSGRSDDAKGAGSAASGGGDPDWTRISDFT